MRIAGKFSFNRGLETIQEQYPWVLEELQTVLASVDSLQSLTKASREKTMLGKMLYNPRALNKGFKAKFHELGWKSHKVLCDYPTEFYTSDYIPKKGFRGTFREMDFVKSRVGIEIQFGKYAFMVYNVCVKMTIFRNLGLIDVGIEVVPVREFAKQMSSGVSYFERFVWDLSQRGVADIDIPVLIVGVI